MWARIFAEKPAGVPWRIAGQFSNSASRVSPRKGSGSMRSEPHDARQGCRRWAEHGDCAWVSHASPDRMTAKLHPARPPAERSPVPEEGLGTAS